MALKLFKLSPSDIEYDRNISYLRSIGLNPAKKVDLRMPSDFSFDHIENLLLLSIEKDTLEYIIFNKIGTQIDTKYFIYHTNRDRSIATSMGATEYIINDENNEFESYFNFFGVSIENFFKGKHHLRFVKNKCTNYIVTYVTNENFNNGPYRFSLSSCYKDGSNIIINNTLTNIQHHKKSFNGLSLIEIADTILDSVNSIVPDNKIEEEKTYKLD